MGRRLSNRRRGVAITSCDGGVAATGKPISVFGFNRGGSNQPLLDQPGFKLVPSREPIEMLVVEKAKD
jgi:hypothetical protein